jgi:hypothetical protein
MSVCYKIQDTLPIGGDSTTMQDERSVSKGATVRASANGTTSARDMESDVKMGENKSIGKKIMRRTQMRYQRVYGGRRLGHFGIPSKLSCEMASLTTKFDMPANLALRKGHQKLHLRHKNELMKLGCKDWPSIGGTF